MLRLYNTLSRKVEEVKPLNPPRVTFYACGPTVYDFQQIGNFRTYINEDSLKRVLMANDLQVKHVMNITDVGHLVSDADEGEDKIEKGARESGKTVWEVAKYYEDDFWKWCDKLNIIRPNVIAKATEHVSEMIKLIQKLEDKGITYKTDEAIYFNTSKFPNYTKLSGQKLEEKVVGVREEVVIDKQKKSPADFVLWFFTIGKYQDHVMKWSSPWGEGFPGWHIECSSMSMLYLGNTIDIHAGGIDHIPVHHTNEIAQSEAATGEKFVNHWMHCEFLLVNGEKMSKSKKNYLTPKDVIEKGFELLALRYLFLTAHYKDSINITWKSLEAAQNALNNLRSEVRRWDQPKIGCAEYEQKFMELVNNDLNIPQALAIVWDLVRSDYPTSAKAESLLKMDQVLGLGLKDYVSKPREIPDEVEELIQKREQVRKTRDFKKSDELRAKIKKLGFEIEDTPIGSKLK